MSLFLGWYLFWVDYALELLLFWNGMESRFENLWELGSVNTAHLESLVHKQFMKLLGRV
jgi:hypothetical protein